LPLAAIGERKINSHQFIVKGPFDVITKFAEHLKRVVLGEENSARTFWKLAEPAQHVASDYIAQAW